MHALIENIFSQSEDALALIDLNTSKIKHSNEKFAQIIGLNQTKGEDLVEVFHKFVPREKLDAAFADLNKHGLAHIMNKEAGLELFFSLLAFESKGHCFLRIRACERAQKVNEYEALFEKNVAGVFKTYSDGTVIDCNPAFAKMLGYDDTNFVKTLNAKSFYPEQIVGRSQFLETLRKNGFVSNFRIKLMRSNGDTITCLENTYLETDLQGNEVIIGTIIDISEQARVEEELHESEQRFKLLSSVGHEGVLFARNERIVDTNEQFAAFFEITSGDIIGRKLSDFFSPTDLKRIFHTINISSNNHLEVRSQTKSGKSIIFDVSGTTIDTKGVETKVLVVSDITARKKTELVLEQTALRFRNLLENSPNAVIILIEDKIKYLNNAAIELIGVEDEDELYDKPFTPIVSKEFESLIAEDLSAIREGAEVDYREIQITNRSGNLVDVGFKATLSIYENKPAIQISLNNISERVQLVQEQMRVRIIEEINTVLKKEIEEHKRTQKLLQEQKNYNQNIINSSLDMIIASDSNGIITEFNESAQKHFGYQAKEIKGKPVSILYHNAADELKVRNILDKKGAFFGEIINMRSNGELFTSLMSSAHIRDDKGKVIGSMGVSRDITETRAIERRAMEQRARLESIFNSTENVMMWTMDRTHKITSLNSNFELWAKSELNEEMNVGTQVTEVLKRHVHEDFYQGQLEGFDWALKGRPQQFEFPLQNTDGKILWLQAFLNPVNFGEKPEEISCLVYDNTERKEIDRRIRDALKEKEVLLQEVHHRVKNNLQVISSILNLQSGYVTDENTLEILKESQQRIKSMSFIHETLYRTADFTSINFSDYLKTLTYNLIQSYRLQNARIEFVPDIEDVAIQIDQAIPCGLIVNELVSNALKYAFKGKTEGHLYVELKEGDNKISLRIADDGVGLPPTFQYEKTDSLGIQLVYTLIEQLDGCIEVKSNKGTEFLITFEKR